LITTSGLITHHIM